MPTNLDKAPAPVGLKAEAAAEEAAAAAAKLLAEQASEEAAKGAPPIEFNDQPEVSIAALASQGRDKLLAALRVHNAHLAEAASSYVPPPASERQIEQRELEFAAGRRAQERHAAQQAARPQPPRDPNEGQMTPVHRDGTFVPKLNSRDPARG